MAASAATAPSTEGQQQQSRVPTAAACPPRKHPCLLFGHYNIQPVVQGQFSQHWFLLTLYLPVRLDFRNSFTINLSIMFTSGII